MDREILFKGFHPDDNGTEKVFVNGEWIKGTWVEGAYMPHYYSSRYGKIPAIFVNDDVLGKTYRYPVIPETVGQYTGLTDKNGTKIFEGDIAEFYFLDKTRRNGKLVTVKNTRTIVIEWGDTSFYMRELFRNYHLDNEQNIITEVIYDYRGNRKKGVYKSNPVYSFEVIGNIYDNPELLEVSE